MEETKLHFATKKSDYNLEITPELEQKIRYLCSKFPQREWSGILFYDYTGAFASKDIKFIAKDFLFMDEGDATSTEFDLDGQDVVTYMCDNDLFGCQCGLLHSHQSMSAFFSGQDDSMLKQEGEKRNHFLSLVVNNAGKYVARITTKETYKYTLEGTSTFKTFNDESAIREVKEDKEVIMVMAYDLNIVMPEITSSFKDLDERIEECKKKKEEKEKQKKEKTYTQQELPFEKDFSCWQKPAVDSFKPKVEKPKSTHVLETDEIILTDEECATYAAQLVTLDIFAKEKDIVPFAQHMQRHIEERFDSLDDYRACLDMVFDEVIDFELGCSLLDYVQDETIDDYLTAAKSQIASYIETATKYYKNDYIDIILNKLYA